MSGHEENLENYLGGMDLFSGGDFWQTYSANAWFWASVVLVIYLIWFLWKNWAKLGMAMSSYTYNPMSASENYSGVPFDYGMRMRSSLTNGDQIGTGQGLEGDIGGRTVTGTPSEPMWAPQRREHLWAPQRREHLSIGQFGARNESFAPRRAAEKFQGGVESPNFWDPNPYLTQAQEWGVPDLSSGFSNTDPRSRVYYGGARTATGGYQTEDSDTGAANAPPTPADIASTQAAAFTQERMSAGEDQLYAVMHGM